jgi:hypothetical protein
MEIKKIAAVCAGLALLGTAGAGCSPRMAATLLGAAIVTAAIIGTAKLLAEHDAHFHDEYCGHPRRYHHGRWVYHYSGHWEYHHGGSWYHY